MSDTTRTFDGTGTSAAEIACWLEGRVPFTFGDRDTSRRTVIAVLLSPEWPVMDMVYPGDTLTLNAERGVQITRATL